MSAKRRGLPARLPADSKYVLESRGRTQGSILVNRYVELPDGRRIELAARMVPTCGTETVHAKAGSREKKDIRAKALA
jgi:hypothetical protein